MVDMKLVYEGMLLVAQNSREKNIKDAWENYQADIAGMGEAEIAPIRQKYAHIIGGMIKSQSKRGKDRELG